MRCAIFTLVAILLASPVTARADVKMDEATKKSVHRALEWLATKQNSDGSFSDGAYSHNTAITAFAMLAFMSQGHLPNQGLHGPEVGKAARFLMASAQPREKDTLYLIGARGGNMYCHAMATLALAELQGQTGDDDMKKVVEKATKLIVGCQSPNGGWRYEPAPTGADISVTIMQVMALRAAKNAGQHVPDITLKKAIDYINSCYNDTIGGFSYQPGGRAPGFARTAAGACILFLTGEYNDARLTKLREAKKPNPVDYLHKNFDSPQHFFYGHYYAAHAMHQVGGKDWEDWYARLVNYFVPKQNPDGSWARVTRHEVGPVYQTSIACIVLSVPAHYLPIFQR